MTGATIEGGGLAQPVDVQLLLADAGSIWQRTDSTRNAADLVYKITMHFDYTDQDFCPPASSVCPTPGKRDASGLFDGVDLLYFPDGLQLAFETWAAGWYRASDELRQQLIIGLPRKVTPPATGDAGLVR